MSFTLMAKVMPMDIGSLAKKMVLLKLADQASDDGVCWPSYQTIAEACQVSRRTVIRHIKSLEVDGFLTITKTYDKANKKNFSNRYQLTLDRGVKLSLVTESHHPSDTVSASGDTVSPKPIIKPTNEPIKKIVAKKEVKFSPVKPNEVSEQTWNDLLQLRKTKRAVESKTAWTRINNAIERAQQSTGHSLEDIYSYWVSKSWTGFDASWYLKAHPVAQQTSYQGNTYENHQPANNQYIQQSHFDKLRAEAAAKYGNTPAEDADGLRTVN